MPRYATMVPLALRAGIALLALAVVEQLILGVDPTLSTAPLGAALYLELGPSFVGFIIYNRAGRSRGHVSAISPNGRPLVVMAGSCAGQGTPVNAAQIGCAFTAVLWVTLLLLHRAPTYDSPQIDSVRCFTMRA